MGIVCATQRAEIFAVQEIVLRCVGIVFAILAVGSSAERTEADAVRERDERQPSLSVFGHDPALSHRRCIGRCDLQKEALFIIGGKRLDVIVDKERHRCRLILGIDRQHPTSDVACRIVVIRRREIARNVGVMGRAVGAIAVGMAKQGRGMMLGA